jgi:glycerol-3-phosphate acyltransferase PlsY
VLETLLWTSVGFLSGAIPFSLLIGRLAAGEDIRDYGDHNPGATNVQRVAGVGAFVVAFLADYLKGVIPVGFAYFVFQLESWQLVPVALAPVLGHMFSPFLRFKGGKAVAATFGIWTGLTLGVVPTLLGLLLILMFNVFKFSGWAVIAAFTSLGFFIITYYGSAHPAFTAVWAANLLLLVYKHHHDLKQPPGLRDRLKNRWPKNKKHKHTQESTNQSHERHA